MLTLFLVAGRVGQAVAFGLASIADGPSTAFGVSAAAAFAASSLSTIALHPLDTVKTRIQAGTTGSNPLLGDLTQPGVAGLYRGLPMNVLKEAPDAAVFLAVSETLAHSLALQSPWFASHVTLTLLFSGAVGDAVGSLLRLPPEVLCKRLQTSATDACWFDQVAEVDKESWMTAWSAILYRDVPFGGLQIAAFHEARQTFQLMNDALGASVPDLWSDCAAGIIAGACSAALTTPLDVLVTHTATVHAKDDERAGRGRANSAPRREKTLGEIAAEPLRLGVRLVEREGPASLVKGMGYRTLYYAPTVGCFFALYEQIRRALEEHLGAAPSLAAEGLGGGAPALGDAAADLGAAMSLPVSEAVESVVGPVIDSAGPLMDSLSGAL